MMKLVDSILTKNPCYKAGKKITVKGLMLHSVGCSQPSASVFIKSWNSESYDRACVHGFIDGNDGTIYRTLPWNYQGWHSGKNVTNNTHIGIEMCEPSTIKYSGGASFKILDKEDALAVAKRTYDAAVELFAYLCTSYGLDPLADGVIISHNEGRLKGIASDHVDPEHLWTGLGLSYTMDGFRKDVAKTMGIEVRSEAKGTQASVFAKLSEAEAVKLIGEMCRADMKKSGVLASVSAAQFILESGYGKSELGQNANNMFGMKTSLSGNTWKDSAWDGTSKYTKKTKEQHTDGTYETITADFRKYPNVEDSVADHSAYLLGAKNGKTLRYPGIKGMQGYREVAQLIKDGGYATSLSYVDDLCSIIERYALTKYDSDGPVSVGGTETPFLARVEVRDLNIRKGPGTNYGKNGVTGIGTFTIMEVREGDGSKSGWGRLKSGVGWISLDYCTRC